MQNTLKDFEKRVKTKKIKIAVVGLGYVGLPLALEFAKKGFQCVGIDIDKDRIAKIKKKESYITDVSSGELKKAVLSNKFSAENTFCGMKDADVIFICVPTPLKRKYNPDISYIISAVRQIAGNIKKGALVILESTTYPGTTKEVILPILEKRGGSHGRDFFLCFSPERIDPGNKKFSVSEISKVLGGISSEATHRGVTIYKTVLKKVVPVSSARVAEMVKLLENTFRLINIGLIDEMAMMAHEMDIDIWEVIKAASTKPFGFMPFYPGPGVGGHCIPKDPLYLYWKAKKFGFKSRFIRLASDIITFMPWYVVDRIERLMQKNGKTLHAAKVLVVGVTYKKDVKDLRKSPALDIIEALQRKNADVSYYDPLIPYLNFNNIQLKSIRLNGKKAGEFACVIIATDHSSVDYKMLLKNSSFIFDSRNVYAGIRHEKIHRL